MSQLSVSTCHLNLVSLNIMLQQIISTEYVSNGVSIWCLSIPSQIMSIQNCYLSIYHYIMNVTNWNVFHIQSCHSTFSCLLVFGHYRFDNKNSSHSMFVIYSVIFSVIFPVIFLWHCFTDTVTKGSLYVLVDMFLFAMMKTHKH